MTALTMTCLVALAAMLLAAGIYHAGVRTGMKLARLAMQLSRGEDPSGEPDHVAADPSTLQDETE